MRNEKGKGKRKGEEIERRGGRGGGGGGAKKSKFMDVGLFRGIIN